MSLNRRQFLSSLALGAAACASAPFLRAQPAPPRKGEKLLAWYYGAFLHPNGGEVYRIDCGPEVMACFAETLKFQFAGFPFGGAPAFYHRTNGCVVRFNLESSPARFDNGERVPRWCHGFYHDASIERFVAYDNSWNAMWVRDFDRKKKDLV